MNPSAIFIRRPVMTALLTVSAVLFGVIAYRTLPVNDLPAVDYPVIQVQVNYPGATPETMSNDVATPLERQFMQIAGLELVTSSSSQGHSSFVLQFDLDKSIDAAAIDVEAAISRAGGALPADLPSPPTFTTTNPNDQPILYIALSSDTVTEGQLFQYASTQVGEAISILPGVSQVAVFGSKSAVRIKVDPSALAIRDLSVDDVSAAVRRATSSQGTGQLDGPDRTILIAPHGQLESALEYEEIIIAIADDAPVRLRDVATVHDTVEDERLTMRFWVRGQPTPPATVVVAVYRQAGANAVKVARSVGELLPVVRLQLPGSVQITPIHDRSRTIVNSVNDVKATLIIAFVLVVIVIFMFLGRTTDTLIPALAMPISLLIVFLVIGLLGYSLDNLSLLALTLAVGFLVDDAIVFLENTVRRMERYGETPLQATVNGAREISFTILSMTLSLGAVFIPLVFMGGLIGRIFREFSVTILVAVLASGLVSLTLTPLMCARLLTRRGEGAKKTWAERVIGAIVRATLDVYGRVLWWFLRRRWISLAIWVFCLVATAWLLVKIPKAFLPTGDSSFIRGVMIAQEGSSPATMRRKQAAVETMLQADPAIGMTFTATGLGNFFPANQGLLLLFLDEPGARAPIAQVAGRLMGEVGASVPGVIALLQPDPVLQISTGATPAQQGKYSYALSGPNSDEVHDIARRLLDALRGYPGFATLSSDLFDHTPSLRVKILRDQARTYGVSPAAILDLLNAAYAQNYVYLIRSADDQYKVIVEVDDAGRSRAEDLALLYVRTDDSRRLVPLSAVAEWREVLGPQSIHHIDQFTSVTIYFNLVPGASIDGVTQFIEATAKALVPPTMKGSLLGEALTFRDTVSGLLVLMGMAVFVMYVILGILYESYVHPLTVLSALPVAMVGGLATLVAFGEEASLYAFIGLFMLMGIVKKNGILIVDFALQRLREGETPERAIHDASVDRFRPIMMTTLAAMMGALPIALGVGADGAGRRPLGLVVVGGLLVSQFITLFVTPVIYLYMEQFQDAVLDKVSFFHTARNEHA